MTDTGSLKPRIRRDVGPSILVNGSGELPVGAQGVGFVAVHVYAFHFSPGCHSFCHTHLVPHLAKVGSWAPKLQWGSSNPINQSVGLICWTRFTTLLLYFLQSTNFCRSSSQLHTSLSTTNISCMKARKFSCNCVLVFVGLAYPITTSAVIRL